MNKVKVIQSDTRQQKGKHVIKESWWENNGVQLVRSKVVFGDYCLPPSVAVDTKENMQEIAGNIGGSAKEHERFRNECQAAKVAGCHLYVLVENEDGISELSQVQYWENPRIKYDKRSVTGTRLYKAMCTMQEKYGVTFLFCKPADSARIITKILENGV